MQSNLQPLTIGQLPTGDIKYFYGDPRQYRFDASRGYFNLDGITPVTLPKAALTVIPLAFRLFKAANLFKKENAQWLELIFINGQGCICATMFHEYSVKNFLKTAVGLFYDGYAPCDAAWTLTPVEKTNVLEKKKYYLLEFGYQLLDAPTKTFCDTIRGEHSLFRKETMKDGVTELASSHWHNLKDKPLSLGFTPVATPELPAAAPTDATPQTAQETGN